MDFNELVETGPFGMLVHAGLTGYYQIREERGLPTRLSDGSRHHAMIMAQHDENGDVVLHFIGLGDLVRLMEAAPLSEDIPTATFTFTPTQPDPNILRQR